MNDGIWHHTGYAKIVEFEPESGDMVVVDSAIIDELWKRTSVQPKDDTNGNFVGTWSLQSYKDAVDSIWSEYPSFVGYQKVVTPTHFIWTQYNAEGDEIMALGGGTYSVQGDQYEEYNDYSFPAPVSASGVTGTFTFNMAASDQWQISGERTHDEGSEDLEIIWKKYALNPPDEEATASGSQP